jgi:hypothetical protein
MAINHARGAAAEDMGTRQDVFRACGVPPPPAHHKALDHEDKSSQTAGGAHAVSPLHGHGSRSTSHHTARHVGPHASSAHVQSGRSPQQWKTIPLPRHAAVP